MAASGDAEIIQQQIDELDQMIFRIRRIITRWPELDALSYGLRLCEQEKVELQTKLENLKQSE